MICKPVASGAGYITAFSAGARSGGRLERMAEASSDASDCDDSDNGGRHEVVFSDTGDASRHLIHGTSHCPRLPSRSFVSLHRLISTEGR